ncbi:MAG: DUF4965 domain-containing protein [Bacteroidales bacterium]|nr:DUF4965 domain-containing protein [Bacteroidales bacterium]
MRFKHILGGLAATLLLFACSGNTERIANTLRAPAYPLVSIDPNTSAWSASDQLFDSPVQHWTGKEFPLIGVLKVDGETYRFLGAEDGEYAWVLPSDDPWTDKMTKTVAINAPKDGERLFMVYGGNTGTEFYFNDVRVARMGRRAYADLFTPLPKAAVETLQEENVLSVNTAEAEGDLQPQFGILLHRNPEPLFAKTAVQNYADVQPTRTIYGFTCGPVDLELTFMAPLLLDNLELVSRPVNYISYDVKANDGKKHDVKVYFEASPLWAVDYANQKTSTECFEDGGLLYLKSGTLSQNILGKKGDDRRIDWGYFYLVSEKEGTDVGIGTGADLRNAFIGGAPVSGVGTSGNDASGRMAVVRDLGTASKASGKVMIGYDDIFSIQYFQENLRPYWNKDGGKTIKDAFLAANNEYKALVKKCAAFDLEMMKDALASGGQEYAELCALAYRQAIHAHKLVEAPNGDLLWLSKENNSNGSIGTVDVTYPSAPLFLLYNPKLAEGLMNHIYFFSESGRWTKPFPAHDVGTYPLANGQTYGGDMPVEEGGNMLTLTAAVCHYENDFSYAKKHWETLTTWTEYLMQFGLDPEDQLCTDDFAGRFAHNINLSVKAILGIASYGYMAGKLGYADVAEKYTKAAKEMAAEWVKMADDGDHYRLTFDRPGTWSQKYNLVWDKLLGLNIFPEDVARKELAYYPSVSNVYGLPLDNRETYTKTDWIMWTATMSEGMEQFQSFVKPVRKFMDETVDRVPMSDWVYTDKPTHRGFKARSVVGGYFIKMLADKKQ